MNPYGVWGKTPYNKLRLKVATLMGFGIKPHIIKLRLRVMNPYGVWGKIHKIKNPQE